MEGTKGWDMVHFRRLAWKGYKTEGTMPCFVTKGFFFSFKAVFCSSSGLRPPQNRNVQRPFQFSIFGVMYDFKTQERWKALLWSLVPGLYVAKCTFFYSTTGIDPLTF